MNKKFRGMPPGGGMGNMQSIMKQAQKMQEELGRKQQELQEKSYEVKTGGGAVTLKIKGDRTIEELTLSPEVVDPDDIEMLQDLIVSAFKEAFEQIDKEAEESMGQMTGGLKIPGLF